MNNPLRLMTILLLVLGSHPSAHAFFCFNFGSLAGANGYGDGRRYPFMLPPPVPYPRSMVGETVEKAGWTPSISREKNLPEIIQGYRFRPLERDPAPSGSRLQQTDWRH